MSEQEYTNILLRHIEAAIQSVKRHYRGEHLWIVLNADGSWTATLDGVPIDTQDVGVKVMVFDQCVETYRNKNNLPRPCAPVMLTEEEMKASDASQRPHPHAVSHFPLWKTPEELQRLRDDVTAAWEKTSPTGETTKVSKEQVEAAARKVIEEGFVGQKPIEIVAKGEEFPIIGLDEEYVIEEGFSYTARSKSNPDGTCSCPKDVVLTKGCQCGGK